MHMRTVGGEAVPAGLFDLSDARQGKPFEIVFPFPAELAKEPGARLSYRLADYLGKTIQSGDAPLTAGDGATARAVVSIDGAHAQTIYLRGRLRISLIVEDSAGNPLYCGTRNLDQLSFARRDNTPLPAGPDL